MALVAAVLLMVLALKLDESAPQRPAQSAGVRPDGELWLPAPPPPAFRTPPEAVPAREPTDDAPEKAAEVGSDKASAAVAPTAAADAASQLAASQLAASQLAAPPPPPAAAARASSAAALADGYRVQLGVFGDPANADNLQAELAARGMPAHIQSRVVLGPYRSRAEAERAQEQLRKEGAEAGMLIAPARRQR